MPETRFTLPRPVILWLLLGIGFGCIVTFLWIARSESGVWLAAPLDDTWIHLVFARNIALGQGFSFNPGMPTPGSTAPLWTLLLTPFMWVSTDPAFVLPAAIGLSLFFYGLTGWLVFRWVESMAHDSVLGFVAAALVLLTGRFGWAGLSGMEVTAFTAVTVAALWVYGRHGLTYLVVILVGLGSQLRPEAHLLILIIGIDSAAKIWVEVRPSPRFLEPFRIAIGRYSLHAALYFAINLPYILFCLSTTGKPLANTFYAKASTGSDIYSFDMLGQAIRYMWWDHRLAALLLPIGLWLLWRHNRVAVMWFVALPIAYGFVLDGLFHHGRYLMPLLVVQMGAAVFALQWLFERLNRQNERHIGWVALLVVPLFSISAWATQLGQNGREILDIDVALGRWIAENTAPDDLIAIDDIGAIGYFGQRQILDMNGLVSPELWPAVRQPERIDINREMTRLLSAAEPDYLASFPLWRWEMVTNPAVAQEIHHVSTPTRTMIFQQDAYVHRIDWPYLDPMRVEPDVDLAQSFGPVMTLIGADLDQSDRELRMTLYWESAAETDIDYKFFVHLLNRDGELIGQVDLYPVAGLAATSVWRPGDVVRDRVSVPLPDTAESLDVHIGWYDEQTGVRLEVLDGPNDTFQITTLE